MTLSPFFSGVHVHFAGFAAVLQRVAGDDGFVREFAFLADGDEADAELVGHGAGEDEPARVDAHHGVHFLAFVTVGDGIHGLTEKFAVLQNRGDVFEQNALDGKIRHVAHGGFELVVHGGPFVQEEWRK